MYYFLRIYRAWINSQIDWIRENESIRYNESLSVTGLFCSPYFPLNLEVLAHNMKNTGLFVSTLYMFLPRCAGQRIETQLPPQLVHHVRHDIRIQKITFQKTLRVTQGQHCVVIKYKGKYDNNFLDIKTRNM